MSIVTRRIFHISATSATLLNTQMGVEDTNDPDLGFRMWCGRDDQGIGPQTGTITKFLAKDQDARVGDISATRFQLTTGEMDVTASAAEFSPSGNFSVAAGGTASIYSGASAGDVDGMRSGAAVCIHDTEHRENYGTDVSRGIYSEADYGSFSIVYPGTNWSDSSGDQTEDAENGGL